MSETYYIANPATTSTVINSLHPYHLYEFSIAAFTAQAKGPSESLMLRMPKGGTNTITQCHIYYSLITKAVRTFLLFHQCLQVVPRASSVML